MDAKPLHELTDDELAQEAKKRYNSYLTVCVLIGMMFGIALYATVKNGFGILTFLPIVFLPMSKGSTKKHKEAKEEMASRAMKH